MENSHLLMRGSSRSAPSPNPRRKTTYGRDEPSYPQRSAVQAAVAGAQRRLHKRSFTFGAARGNSWPYLASCSPLRYKSKPKLYTCTCGGLKGGTSE